MKYEDTPRYCPKCGALMVFIGWDSTNTVCWFRCNKCQTKIGD